MAKATPITEIMTGSTANIMRVLNSANDAQIAAGIEWYERANRLAVELSEKHDFPVENVVFAIAALSPIKDWGGNKQATIELVETGNTKNQTPENVAKAKRCLAGDLGALRGQKVTRFAGAIMNPQGNSVACIDRHAFSIWMGEKQSDIQQKVLTRKGAYEMVADAYDIAAQISGRPVHEVQAITWVVWRDMHDVVRKIGK